MRIIGEKENLLLRRRMIRETFDQFKTCVSRVAICKTPQKDRCDDLGVKDDNEETTTTKLSHNDSTSYLSYESGSWRTELTSRRLCKSTACYQQQAFAYSLLSPTQSRLHVLRNGNNHAGSRCIGHNGSSSGTHNNLEISGATGRMRPK